MADKKINLDWKNVGRLALILFLITAIASLCLALTNYVTADTIAERNEQSNIEARQQVLPEADRFEAVHDVGAIAEKVDGEHAAIVVEAYQGFKGNATVGYTVKTTPSGYGGEIEVLTGIGMDGKITGVTILSHNETAGLGAKSTEPEFQNQFQGKDATKDLTVIKNGQASDNQIQAITGATITSDAVTDGVNVSTKIFGALSETGKGGKK